MIIHFDKNTSHVETASNTGLIGLFSGRAKARIHLGSPSNDTHSIALIKDRTFSKEELKSGWWENLLGRLKLRNWVALKVDTKEGGGETYIKVNKSSLKNREGLTDDELNKCITEDILDPTQNEKLKSLFSRREAFDKVMADGNNLPLLEDQFKNDYEVIFAAIKKSPEAVQYINHEILDRDMKRALREEILNQLPKLPPDIQRQVCSPELPWTPFFLRHADPKIQKEIIEKKPDLLSYASIEVILEEAKSKGQVKIVDVSHFLGKKRSVESEQTFDQLFQRLPTADQINWLCGKTGAPPNTAHTDDFKLLSSVTQKQVIRDIERLEYNSAARTFFSMANADVKTALQNEFPQKYS